jgi:hypothetical protein
VSAPGEHWRYHFTSGKRYELGSSIVYETLEEVLARITK